MNPLTLPIAILLLSEAAMAVTVAKSNNRFIRPYSTVGAILAGVIVVCLTWIVAVA